MRVGRTPSDNALLNAAALVELENGLYRRVRLVFGGVNMEATRLFSIERQLEGQPAAFPVNGQLLRSALEASMNEFRPPSDTRVSGGYRRVCGMNLAYRALEEATSVAHWRNVVSSREGV
jgi:CO/xanthine dehydrogenase FAD-binding subunit